MDVWYPIQVNQKDRVGRPDIDSFEAIMTREDRTKSGTRCVPDAPYQAAQHSARHGK